MGLCFFGAGGVLRIFFVLVCAFSAGFIFIFFTNNKYLVHRNPSAIRQHYDFTHLKGTALEVAMRERIISQIEIVKNEEGFGLSLGNFAFKNNTGDTFFGCQYFNKVVLIFEGEGAIVGGMEKPLMEVEGPCESSEDLARINAFMIPMKQFMTERPLDGDFNHKNKISMSFKFLNLPDAWPTIWNLIGVKMSSSQKDFIIDRNEITKIIGQSLLITFN